MAIPSYMRGLLNDEDSLLPSAGLLGAAAGNSPIPQALAAMASKSPTPQQGPVASPRVLRGSPAAPMETQPPKPLMSPTSAGLLSGGIAALEANPGSAYTGPGPVVAAALKAGLSSYVAGKQQEQESKVAVAQAERFRTLLQDPDVIRKLDPVEHKFIAAMQPGPGMAQLQKALERKREVTNLGVRDKLVANDDGAVIAEGNPKLPDPENLDPGKDLTTAIELSRSPLTGKMLRPEDRAAFKPEEWAVVEEKLKALGPKGTNITVNAEGKALDKGLADLSVKSLSEEREKAVTAVANRRQTQELRRQLTAGIKSGAGANALLLLGQITNQIGLTDDETVRNTERYMSGVIRSILPDVKQLRPASDTDLKILLRADGGNITWDKQSLSDILRIKDEIEGEKIRAYQSRLRTAAAEGLDPRIIPMLQVEDAEADDTPDTVDFEGAQVPAKRQQGKLYLWVKGQWRLAKDAP